jgi:pectinesterase inhibitor-like protein
METVLFIGAMAVFLMFTVAGATVETTCKAAGDIDKRVNVSFCVWQLKLHHDSTEADTWGLAQITALIGSNNAGSTRDDIDALLAKPSTGDKMKPVLKQCRALYDGMVDSFLIAHDDLNERNYAAGKEKVAETIRSVHQCDEAFVKAGIPSPLAKQSADSVQLAIICTAITNLIK